MTEKTIKIDGMSCQHCVKAVEEELEFLNLDSYEVQVGSALVKYDEAIIEEEKIIEAIKNAGYDSK